MGGVNVPEIASRFGCSARTIVRLIPDGIFVHQMYDRGFYAGHIDEEGAGEMKHGRWMTWALVCLAGVGLLGMAAGPARAQSPARAMDEKLWSGMKWRQIGPFRGGRVLAVTGVQQQPNVYYFGAVSGGVWKTTNGGLTWLPMTDKEKFASVGAIAVAPSDPNVIYVGTGEACLRGNISFGNGMYKSVDGGKTWVHLGLDDTRHIARIAVDPRDANTVLVAAMGHAFGPNTERGVYKTTDGGKTWRKVLYKDENTGATDLVFDPTNSHVLFAAMYQARRQPWDFTSGGPGSGLYRSRDSGETWKQLTEHGLPKGILGRIGVAVSGANPQRVYALIEAKEGGLYRSDDGGDAWDKVNDDHKFRQRAWYFTHVFADPQNTNTVYILNTGLFRSTDGGEKFDRLLAPHGDHHGLWIDPTNSKRMINGNDGGATITVDGGERWSTEENQPTAQFYHVTTDTRFLYHVYGAQQDNSTVGIASRTDTGGIDVRDWDDVGGGESGYIAVDPRDPDIIYAGDNGGFLTRRDQRTKQTQDITVWPEYYSGHGVGELKHRFQWTAPIIISPNDPNTLYIGGEQLFKTTDGGHSWTAISPDLTRNDKSKQAAGGPITKDNTSVEYYDVIFTIAESALKKGMIWVGTDDGLIQLSDDGGAHWTNVTPKDLPEWSMVSLIEASPFDAETAYAAIDRHKLDDEAPYVYVTHDSGKTWNRLNEGIPAGSYVHAVRSDTARRGLLFAGTETGVYVSFDDGQRWQSLQLNLPDSPVHDLAVKDGDVVAATHGRSFWILDDIEPLRAAEAKISGEEAYLYKPAKAVRYRTGEPISKRYEMLVGQNAAGGVTVDYFVAKKPAEKEEIRLEVLDSKGKVIRKYTSKKEEEEQKQQEWDAPDEVGPLPAEAGMNRFTWDLKYEGAHKVKGVVYDGGEPPKGPYALPGKYTLRLTAGGKTLTQMVDVALDPRLNASAEDLQKQLELALKTRDLLNITNDSIRDMRDVSDQLDGLQKRLANDASAKAILEQAKAVEEKITPIVNALYNKNIQSTEDSLNYPVKLNNQVSVLGDMIESADTAPTEGQSQLYEDLTKKVNEQVQRWNEVRSKDLAMLNAEIRKKDIPAIAPAPAKTE
jgi:photosystem II stability/assembly factor-like uncharacterized protein/DNA-binding FrmR family transcriptional regulator